MDRTSPSITIDIVRFVSATCEEWRNFNIPWHQKVHLLHVGTSVACSCHMSQMFSFSMFFFSTFVSLFRFHSHGHDLTLDCDQSFWSQISERQLQPTSFLCSAMAEQLPPEVIRQSLEKCVFLKETRPFHIANPPPYIF